MAPVVKVRLSVKAQEGPCEQCTQAISEAALHVTAIRGFGQSKKGRAKMHSAHLHLSCVPAFLLADYVQWTGREKKPRGRNRNLLPPEQQAQRKHLIRTRARLLRLVLATRTEEEWPHEDYIRYRERIDHLRERILQVQVELAECGGLPRQSLVRRGAAARALLEARLNV